MGLPVLPAASQILPDTTTYLCDAGFTAATLEKAAGVMQKFHGAFSQSIKASAGVLSVCDTLPQDTKFIRRCGGIAEAVLQKLGSHAFTKRRPEDTAPYLAYLQKRCDEEASLHFRIVVGPVKNVRRYGAQQEPDLAEYLMLMQLARLMEAVARIYPYGVRVQLVPDDLRGRIANDWPEEYSRRYIRGLWQMVRELQFHHWLEVEPGQARLYEEYNVPKYLPEAKEEVVADPHFSLHLTQACLKARENLITQGAAAVSASLIRESAMRYLVCHKAEILSGMWSPEDAFALIYANHPGNFQLYTMKQGVTKLPWQVKLPFECLAGRQSSYEKSRHSPSDIALIEPHACA